MDMKLNRNLIFLGFILVVFVLIVWIAAEAKVQDTKFYTDYSSFSQATGLMRQGDFAQAQVILGSLLSEYDDSFQINYYYGVCLSEQGLYKEAARYLLSAQKIRPALLGEQGYLFSYGKVLYKLDDNDAGRYLRGSIKYGKNQEMIKTAQQMLKDIDSENLAGDR